MTNQFFFLNVNFTVTRLILSLGIFLISSASFSQEMSVRVVSVEWQPLTSTDFVDVSYRYGECLNPSQGVDKQEVYLKFTNKTNEKLSIVWENELHYGKRCINCDGLNDEMRFEIALEPKSSINGECGKNGNSKLRFMAKFLNIDSSTVLTEFKVKNIIKLQDQ
jgi:hypothetical protein